MFGPDSSQHNEQGSAYISVIIIAAILFIWMTFQLDRLLQNQQTIQYDTGILQAQYVAESGIEHMRLLLREQAELAGPVVVSMGTGTAEVEVINHEDPFRIRSVGRVEPDMQQSITVELDPNTLKILTWSRKKQQ